MTTEIDQLLADWKNKIQAVSQNLFDLQELTTYQRLCGKPGYAKVHLTGITATRVTPALLAMNDLFQYFDLLVQTVDKASRLRQQLPRFLPTEQKINEIKQLLTGASIQLSVVQTPLAQRELLSANQQALAITPAQLLQLMTEAFLVARDVVLAVDTAWAKLEPRLAEAESQIIEMQNLASSLNEDSLSELVQASAVITSLRARIEQDPLGVSAEINPQIKPLLAQLSSVLESKKQQQIQLQEKLALADELFQQLIIIHTKSVEAFAERQEKVLYLIPHTPLTQEQMDAFSQWLTRLQNKLEEGLINPVMIGLDNWLIKAKEYIAVEHQTYTANNTLLQTRQELRGRLDALTAKALARQLIEDPTLVDLAQQAKQLLYVRPTPLEKASELVSQYEKLLNSKS